GCATFKGAGAVAGSGHHQISGAGPIEVGGRAVEVAAAGTDGEQSIRADGSRTADAKHASVEHQRTRGRAFADRAVASGNGDGGDIDTAFLDRERAWEGARTGQSERSRAAFDEVSAADRIADHARIGRVLI